MRIQKHAGRIAAVLASLATMAALSSQAQVSGEIWENWTANTVTGGPPTGAPSVTFTANQIDFGNAGNGFTTPYTIGGWLDGNAGGGIPSGTPPTTVNVLTGAGALGDSDDNTYVQLTGVLFLNAGANNFAAGHDDGLIMSVAGLGVVLNDPGPTAFALTPFTITAPSAGDYDYTVDYNECCGPPGALELALPNGIPIGSVPDAGSTMSLFGIGLAGIATVARRFRK